MTGPAAFVWDLAGQPPVGRQTGKGDCALCGVFGPLHGRLNANFSDHRLLADPHTTGLCGPCSWALSGRPPDALRMWSIVARPDTPAPPSQPRAAAFASTHVQATSRRDLRWAAATLADPPPGPWLVAVTETAQRHTVPFAQVNHGTGRWTVRMDGVDVTATLDQWRGLMAVTARLRAAGFTAADLETGEPSPTRLTGERLDLWLQHRDHICWWAGTPCTHLANLTITKDTLDDHLATFSL